MVSSFQGVADSQAKLAGVRDRLYKGGIDPAAFSGTKSPKSGYSDLRPLQLDFADVFKQPRALTQELANVLTATTTEGRAVNAASVISALSQATSEAADEIVNVNLALTSRENSRDAQLAAALESTKIRQQDLIGLAEVHATPDQQKAIAALNQDDSILIGARRVALAHASTGQPVPAGQDPVGFTVDGPRGPARVAQPGAVWLAGATGRPVLPLHVEASRAWKASSWDRTEIPKPMATVSVVVGEPMFVDGTDAALVETKTRELERTLARLEVRARELLSEN